MTAENTTVDDEHLNLVNHLIGVLNDMIERHGTDVIASAGVAAAAAFSVFNLSCHGARLTDDDVERCAQQFAGRMREFQIECREG